MTNHDEQTSSSVLSGPDDGSAQRARWVATVRATALLGAGAL